MLTYTCHWQANNLPEGNDIDECLRNIEKDEGNETSYSLHDTLIYYLF
jgi:hypothetical protein